MSSFNRTYTVNETDLKQSLFLLKGRKRKNSELCVIGTAFCVAAFDQGALLFTAGHNISAIYDLEKSPVRANPNCPFPAPKPNKIEQCEIFVLFQDQNAQLHECPLINITSWNAYDVACLWIKKPLIVNGTFAKFSIDTQPPKKGSNVCMIGFDQISVQGNLVSYRIHTKIGNVLRVFHNDINLGRGAAKQPYIQTNIPILSGCSGAPLIDLETSCVIGIASHDSGNSSGEENADGQSSVFAPVLPALGITLPKQIKISGQGEQSTGFDLVLEEIIKDISQCNQTIKLKTLKKNGLAVNFEWNYCAEVEENIR